MSHPQSISDEQYISRYHSYEELTRILEQWARTYPEVVRLSSLAKSLQGKEVWLLEIGREPDRKRPAVWIDGNMHSTELLGCSVALHVARILIELHSRPEDFQGPEADAARRLIFYIVPRMSPDGAEAVLSTGKVTRSAPRDRRAQNRMAYWTRSDMDGDGRIRQMRKVHPAGEFVQHPHIPHVLVRRQLGDEGPYYKVFPEGFIQNFDGFNVPYPLTMSDNDSDFNRGFPFSWISDREGSCNIPGVDPETHAIIEFASRAPHIFVWLNLHTFGGVFIRPPFAGSDTKMDHVDLQTYTFLERLIEQRTGLQTMSAIEEMTPLRDQPMTGTLASWAYEERGCFSWAVELWDLFAATRLKKRKPFFRNYAMVDRDEIQMLVNWDRQFNNGQAFNEWTPFEHPQLGSVEIGGIDVIRGLMNPPEAEIKAIGESMARLVVAFGSFVPRLKMFCFAETISDDISRVTLSVINIGWLATCGTNASRHKSWNKSIQVILSTFGCRLIAGPVALELDHIPGWGEGAEGEDSGPFFQRSSGIADTRLTWVVRGLGELKIEVGNERLGWQSVMLSVPGSRNAVEHLFFES